MQLGIKNLDSTEGNMKSINKLTSKRLLLLIVCFVAIAGCISNEPPASVLNSIVIARNGIDDFGELKVSAVVDALEKFTKKRGGKVFGWSKKNGEYLFTVQQPNLPRASIAFRVIDDNIVFTYFQDTPNPMSTIQTIRTIYWSVYPPKR